MLRPDTWAFSRMMKTRGRWRIGRCLEPKDQGLGGDPCGALTATEVVAAKLIIPGEIYRPPDDLANMQNILLWLASHKHS